MPRAGRAPAQIPPHDLAAEEAVLGAGLQEDAHGPRAREALSMVLTHLGPADLFSETHRIVFTTLGELASRGLAITPIILIGALRAGGHDPLFGEPATAIAARLYAAGAIPAHVPSYIEVILECRIKRDVLRLAREITIEATNGVRAPAVLDSARLTLDRLVRRTQRGRVHPIPARQFAAEQPPRPGDLITGLLARGAGGWIGGPPKKGKSAVALDLLIAAALGEPWLGQFPIPEPVTSVFVEEEDPAWRVHERLTALCRGRGLDAPPERLYLLVRAGLRLDDEAALLEFEHELRDIGAALVIWDVFRRLHRQSGKPDDLLPLLYRLDTLGRRVGCSNLILHHFRKQAPSGRDFASGGERLAGSGGLWGWTENALYLSPAGAKRGHVIVEAESKEGAPDPFKIHLEVDEETPTRAWHSARWVYDGVAEARAERGEQTRRQVLDALAGRQCTVIHLVHATGLAERTIRRDLGTLRRDGAVDSVKPPGQSGQKLWFRIESAHAALPEDATVPF